MPSATGLLTPGVGAERSNRTKAEADEPGFSLRSRRQHCVAQVRFRDSFADLTQHSLAGREAVGMHRQDYDLQLTQYDDCGW